MQRSNKRANITGTSMRAQGVTAISRVIDDGVTTVVDDGNLLNCSQCFFRGTLYSCDLYEYDVVAMREKCWNEVEAKVAWSADDGYLYVYEANAMRKE
jgi:hypothetical protein